MLLRNDFLYNLRFVGKALAYYRKETATTSPLNINKKRKLFEKSILLISVMQALIKLPDTNFSMSKLIGFFDKLVISPSTKSFDYFNNLDMCFT